VARILVIEDEEDIRGLYSRILKHAGHDVIDAPDGKVGIELYRENPADLVITDIIMPEKEGIELIRELRRDFPEAKIIAVSGGGQATSSSTCLRLAKGFGAVKTLAKPFSQQELVDTVREVLNGM
jgi:DNA-binding response OmpR family regulator